MTTNLTVVVVWLLPYVAIGGIVFCGALLVKGIGGVLADHLRDGPRVRAFRAIAPRANGIKAFLMAHHDNPATGSQRPAELGAAYAQIAVFSFDLRRLGIETPKFVNLDDAGQVHFLISWLAAIETFAASDQLQWARGIGPEELVHKAARSVQGPTDG